MESVASGYAQRVAGNCMMRVGVTGGEVERGVGTGRVLWGASFEMGREGGLVRMGWGLGGRRLKLWEG